MTSSTSGDNMTGDQSNPMPSHTPGPWSVYDGTGCLYPGIESHEHDVSIVVYRSEADGEEGEVGVQGRNPQEAIANARLIAAAPDMLAALKDLTRFCEAVRVQVGMGKTQLARLEAARAAIAKATGGDNG